MRFTNATVASLAILAMVATPAVAQTEITNPVAAAGAGNTPDDNDPLTATSCVRSTVSLPTADPNTIVARYTALLSCDSLPITGNPATQTLVGEYTVSLDATAPVGYALTVETSLEGAVTFVDIPAPPLPAQGVGTIDLSMIAGSHTGGTLITAADTLGLLPGGTTLTTTDADADNPLSETNSATIHGVSNGAPVSHTLTFSFTADCTAEYYGTALRMGLLEDVWINPLDPPNPVPDGQCLISVADDYAGITPFGRDASTDGHFARVTITSLCGNGTTESTAGETCDDANAANTDACLNNCQLATCGDGLVWAGVEDCDDGNNISGDGCSAMCMVEVPTMPPFGLFLLAGLLAMGGLWQARLRWV